MGSVRPSEAHGEISNLLPVISTKQSACVISTKRSAWRDL